VRTRTDFYVGTNALVSMFTDDSTTSKLARQAVLDMAARLPLFSGLVKSLVMRQLTGEREGVGPTGVVAPPHSP
jgi:hypothetical protein